MRLLFAAVLVAGCAAPGRKPSPVATFSIVGFDPVTGDLGIAVQSKFFGVGSVVPYAAAGVGAVATQAWANVRYGPDGLKLLRDGKTATQAVETLTKADPRRARRQLGVVDAKGRAASFTGTGCLDWAGHAIGDGYAVQGNVLAGEAVVRAMGGAFQTAKKKKGTDLADWLMAALGAGQDAGGDKRGRQSAALLVVRKGGGYGGGNDRYIDLRVEDDPKPIEELARLLELKRKYLR